VGEKEICVYEEINEKGKEKKNKRRMGRKIGGEEEEKKKVKVILSLCLIKLHDIKAYWASGCIAPHILILGTGWR
jgi:hypothetical protein